MALLIPILVILFFAYLLWEIREKQMQTVKKLESIEALLKRKGTVADMLEEADWTKSVTGAVFYQ